MYTIPILLLNLTLNCAWEVITAYDISESNIQILIVIRDLQVLHV